jgi:hypothetical protein
MKTTLSIAAVAVVATLTVTLPEALAGAPAAEPASDGGTTVSVQVGDGGDTTIAVHGGSDLKVRAGGKETRVGRGQGVHVRRGEAPTRVKALPAPDLKAPSDGQRIGSTDVSLGWSEIKGARAYHVAVATDSGFKSVVHDERVKDTPKSSVHLEAGTYYVRVAAIDGVGLEGRFSSTRRFVVDLTPPNLKTGKPEWR